uniref:Uncharacterized protein n=1 Tax=Brassica oleracea var. oleracea TaxID=109376 RepID=A0A0D2ZYQ7_BRAOL
MGSVFFFSQSSHLPLPWLRNGMQRLHEWYLIIILFSLLMLLCHTIHSIYPLFNQTNKKVLRLYSTQPFNRPY